MKFQYKASGKSSAINIFNADLKIFNVFKPLVPVVIVVFPFLLRSSEFQTQCAMMFSGSADCVVDEPNLQ